MARRNYSDGYEIMARRNYSDGYLEKIDYWILQLSIGRNTLDFALIKKAADKLVYFSGRHQELIDSGKMVPGQSGTISESK